MGPHVMAFSVTNLGVVSVLYPPNSEESQNKGCDVSLRPKQGEHGNYSTYLPTYLPDAAELLSVIMPKSLST